MEKLKNLSLLLLCTVMGVFVTACSDDDKNIIVTDAYIVTWVGTWDVVWLEQDGEGMDVPFGYIYYITLNEDSTYRTTFLTNTYIGTYEVQGNTIVGTTLDHITEYYCFTSVDRNNASISYSNSTGDKYNFQAVKR